MSLAAFLQQLVRVPSVNPDNEPGIEAAGEGALAAFLARWLTDLGAAVTLEEIRPGRPNVIARFAPRDGRPRILLGPDLATAELDLRTTPALAAAGGALALLEHTIAAAGLPLAVDNPHETPPMETPADHPDVRRLLAAAPGTRLAGAPWFSDATHLARAGLPAVCLGPGSIDQAHTADEFIDVAALEQGAACFDACLAALTAGG